MDLEFWGRLLNGVGRRGGLIVGIVAVCWLLVRGVRLVEQVLFKRLRMDVEDNRRIRRTRTRVTLLRRLAVVLVVVIGLVCALMTVPQLHTFSTSMFASAGVAGIVAGLAAQTTLSNMFAGLQLVFTDAVRMDDVVVVEAEWGWVEEITLTYVVLHLWDERRLVLPTSYFTTTPFQNWTRNEARVLGAVTLYLDYATPLTALRERAEAVVRASPLWDGRDWVLQVIDTTEHAIVVRVLASATDGPTAFDLRCEIREALITYLQQAHPQALPAQRFVVAAHAEQIHGEQAHPEQIQTEVAHPEGVEPGADEVDRPTTSGEAVAGVIDLDAGLVSPSPRTALVRGERKPGLARRADLRRAEKLKARSPAPSR